MRINVFEGARRIALVTGAVWAVGCVVYGAISQRSAHITLAISGPGETPAVAAKCDGDDESRYALGTVDQVDTVSALLCFKAQRASDGRMLIPYMGYVRLPDGTDFPGVPQDPSKPALDAKLTSLTKGRIAAATRSLAIEYAMRGVRVNAVSPGVIKTPMHVPEAHAMLAGLHPVGRMGEIADIVDAIVYLETAEFVTGEILHVDGRQSAGH